ncbi:MAG TPA: phosphoenolpyruvate--protein phosphotransferase [Clostridiales bacterium]|jgi:phosphotransferase system enzyme I (PtsI)|nr:phosphoenolpyruvate--protein phosphotransferase [Clostridiales bacterium]
MQGIAASPGIAIGNVYLFNKETLDIDSKPIEEGKIYDEIKRFEEAKDKTRKQLEAIQKSISETLSKEEFEIFTAHMMMVNDPTLSYSVERYITVNKLNAEAALDKSINEIWEMFQSMDDDYIKDRAIDIRDVGTKMLYNLAGREMASLAKLDDEVIVVSTDLTPSDTAQMDTEKVLGFVTDLGGKTSHTAIIARSLEIPAVIGLRDATTLLRGGEMAIVDGNKGIVIFNPTIDQIEHFNLLKKNYQVGKKELQELRTLPAMTLDGRKVEMAANIGMTRDVKSALKNGAEGIGLFRTEFLFMDRATFPSEDDQFNAYRLVGEQMEGRPVIIRTLDIGGDKNIGYMDFPKETNPYLGWRAIRMCLDRPEILKNQLRAILRASHYGNLRVMYPMIISIEEIRKANQILNEAKNELSKNGTPFDNNIQVGIMVETPAAALNAESLIEAVDFVSIGTNDLTQYTLAVDRGNEAITHLYQPMHPAVLRLIKIVIDASHKAGKWVGMCGEMAGDARAAILLLGMGLDEFSMSAGSIPNIKKIIRGISYKKAKCVADCVLSMTSSEEIVQYLDDLVL